MLSKLKLQQSPPKSLVLCRHLLEHLILQVNSMIVYINYYFYNLTTRFHALHDKSNYFSMITPRSMMNNMSTTLPYIMKIHMIEKVQILKITMYVT
jgi:hypothetical protein